MYKSVKNIKTCLVCGVSMSSAKFKKHMISLHIAYVEEEFIKNLDKDNDTQTQRVTCPLCLREMPKVSFEKHLQKHAPKLKKIHTKGKKGKKSKRIQAQKERDYSKSVHKVSRRKKTVLSHQNNKYIKCKICQSSLKSENIEKHVLKVHKLTYTAYRRRRKLVTEIKLSDSSRQSLLSRINQGRFDVERKLLVLMDNAESRNEAEILKAVHQRLKKIYPQLYRRLVGPIELRDPLGSKTCYCATPTSIENIAKDIIDNTVPRQALLCDACWNEDIAFAWGVYGTWGKKVMLTEIWKKLCFKRAKFKYSNF